MKTFQTQCPNCAKVFNISENRLAMNDSRGRCPHCKQIFSAKENLIKTPPPLTDSQKQALVQLQQQKQQLTPDSMTAPQTLPHTIESAPTPVPVVANPVSQTMHHADVPHVSPTLHDDVAVTEPITSPTTPSVMPLEASNIDFDLTDDFAPSVTTQSATPNATHPAGLTKKQKRAKTGEGLISDEAVPDELANGVLVEKTPENPATANFELDILEDFDLQPNRKTAEIDYHQPVSDKVNGDTSKLGDESWVEALMAEEKIKERDKSFLEDSGHNPVGTKSDVADLLNDMGVGVMPEVALSKEAYIQKMSERLEHTTHSQQAHEKKSLLVPLLWGLGCLLLLGLLTVQYVAFNVNELVKHKNYAQTLTSLCQATHLPCHLAQADLASVDIKTLKVENNNGKTDLLFTLTNKSSQPVLYPNLKISLQKANSSVTTLVLSPEQYLDEVTPQMAPQQIKPIKLRVAVVRNSFDQVLIESFY